MSKFEVEARLKKMGERSEKWRYGGWANWSQQVLSLQLNNIKELTEYIELGGAQNTEDESPLS